MKFNIIFIEISIFLSIINVSQVLSDDDLDKLKCKIFYVKIFNTATKTYEYTCQDYVSWDDKSTIFCTDDKPLPYVIVYSTINWNAGITYYKMCCRTKECFNRVPFNPLNRFGVNTPIKWKGKPLSQSDVRYLDIFVEKLVAAVLFLSVIFIVYHMLFIRSHVVKKWSDAGEKVDPVLLIMAEKPNMEVIRLGHKDITGTSITGQHSLMDYCRVLAARSFRDNNIVNSQLVDPKLVCSRILRHDLRKVREDRLVSLLKWKIYHNRLHRNQNYVKIGGKWIYISRKMRKMGFLARNNRVQVKKTCFRYIYAIKNYLKLVTKSHFDSVHMHEFDKYDICHLMNLCSKNEDMFMIFFNAAGLAHDLYQVQRPVGNVNHKTVFEALYFHGPYFYPWKPNDLIELFDNARELFMADSMCLQLGLPIVIIGEIRGRYTDLHRWLQIIGLPYRRKLLFLGGYLERGSSSFEEYSIECLSFIASLKVAYPKYVFMLRGSAETAFSFSPRFNVTLDNAVLSAARQMCNCMPLTAVIENQYLAISSGLSPYMLYDLFRINSIDRPLVSDNLPYYIKFILFGQPTSTMDIFDHDEETGTFRYGLQAVEDVCKNMELKAIIRSRNELPINPFFLRNQKFITISSCPTVNSGGVTMLIDEGLGWLFFKLRYQTDEVEIPPRDDSVSIEDETEI